MRLLITLAVLLAGSLAVSYAVAPVPKQKPNPTVEKLIGVWKRVKWDGRELPPKVVITIEFAKDGRVTMRAKGGRMPVPDQTGKYALVGDVLRYTMDPPADPPDRVVRIESLTSSKLTVVGGLPGAEQTRNVYTRTDAK